MSGGRAGQGGGSGGGRNSADRKARMAGAEGGGDHGRQVLRDGHVGMQRMYKGLDFLKSCGKV